MSPELRCQPWPDVRCNRAQGPDQTRWPQFRTKTRTASASILERVKISVRSRERATAFKASSEP